MKYPIYIPEIKEKERKYVLDCIDSTWISSKGKYVDLFEEKIQEFTGVKHAVAVFNGTVALHLALDVIGIKPGDEIILPDFTYIASANAVLYLGATPVLADVSKETWNITLDEIRNNVTTKTKAIIITDIYGTPPEMDKIMEFAKSKGIIVVADSAESLGATYKGKHTGNIADISTYSFFGNKTITTGEGGMVTTNNDEYNYLLRKKKNQGNHDAIRYFHDVLGYNFRMTNIQAAIGCAQMERIEDTLERKKNLFGWYKEELKGLVKFQEIEEYITSSIWMVCFLLPKNINREDLMKFMDAKGIETRPFFFPIHEMPFYSNVENKNTIEISKHGMNVPSYPQLKKEDVVYICNQIKEYLKNNG